MKSFILLILVAQATACDLYYWETSASKPDPITPNSDNLDYTIRQGMDYPSFVNCGFYFEGNNKISIDSTNINSNNNFDIHCYSNFKIILTKNMIPINLLQDLQYIRFDINYRVHDYFGNGPIRYYENIRFRVIGDGTDKKYSSIGSLPNFDISVKPEFRRAVVTYEIPKLEDQRSVDLIIEIERYTTRNEINKFPDNIIANPATITINSIEKINSL